MPYSSFLAPLAAVSTHTRQRSTSCWMPVTLRTTTTTSSSSSNRHNKTWQYGVVNDSAQRHAVFLVAACTGVALVPYGHSRFCTNCVETVALVAMDSCCPVCRSPIQIVLRVFKLVVTLPTILTLRCFAVWSNTQTAAYFVYLVEQHC